MRRPIKKKIRIAPDARYNSERLEKFINNVMLDGRKETARKVVYGALDEIKAIEEKKGDGARGPLEVFEEAIRNVGPSVEVRSRRVGGANYQVPREVRAERRQALAMRWIITAARAKSGGKLSHFLADELLQAANNEGSAVKKKEDTHRMADSNRAFAHFAW
jgi:small subunit ribosomal protein S7